MAHPRAVVDSIPALSAVSGGKKSRMLRSSCCKDQCFRLVDHAEVSATRNSKRLASQKVQRLSPPRIRQLPPTPQPLSNCVWLQNIEAADRHIALAQRPIRKG